MSERRSLTPHELAVLRHVAGGPANWHDGRPMVWGAAMSAIIEALHEAGLVTYPNVEITDAGRRVLASLEPVNE